MRALDVFLSFLAIDVKQLLKLLEISRGLEVVRSLTERILGTLEFLKLLYFLFPFKYFSCYSSYLQNIH